MTAVIYARYSSDNQREESIEGQIRECTAYAEKNGITIVKHYIDRAISAKTDNRPEFQQMIKDSDKKLFDIVLVWKLDRFARNRYDSARYKTQLKKNGVKLMSATEIISEGPEGIILESVLEGYAEYYSADLAEKVVRGQTENILKGRCNGGRGTFGYTLDSERKFHIDPLASLFVLEAFRKYRDGLTMKEIRDWLNENGIKNPVGSAFAYNSVEHMLKNRRYIGELKFRDVVVPDAIPLLGMLFLGNLLKESGVVKRLATTASNQLIDIMTILIGITVGASTQASVFLTPKTLGIFVLGACSFFIATMGGVLFVKLMNLFLKEGNKINPLIGNAGVSAVPAAARVSQDMGIRYDRSNYLLMHAMGPNVAGVIGSACAAGFMIKVFGG